MTSFSSETDDVLRGPSDIDAHLMFAALEGVAAVLHADGYRIPGRFDFADGFGEIAFIDQRTSAPATGLPCGNVRVEYFLGRHDLHQFETAVLGRTAQDRVRLARPRSIQRSQRRFVPRFRIVGREAYSFVFTQPENIRPAEVLDLSNQGARLVVDARQGLDRGGFVASGWLSLPEETGIPVTIEFRHVAPHDVGRLVVGVRFLEIRTVDQVRLTRHILCLSDPGGRAA